MPVDNTKVRDILNGVYAYMNSQQKDWLQRTPEFFHLAWLALKKHRGVPELSSEEDLAAAEHYLFARYAVGSAQVSGSQMSAQAVAYGGIKATAQGLDGLIGKPVFEPLMRNKKEVPTSAASAGQVLWGLQGVSDGDKDRQQFNSHKDPPIFNPDFAQS